MSGPGKGQFGEMVSSALSSGPEVPTIQQLLTEYRISLGQIWQIYTIDDTQNSPSTDHPQFTLYDVMVYRQDGSTEMVERCRALQPLHGGSFNNFHEVAPASPGQLGKDALRDRQEKRGTLVAVAYAEGRKSSGLILGAMPSPNRVAIGRRPRKAQGSRLEGEFQGLQYLVDNEGALTITFNGPRDDLGNVTTDSGPTTIKIDRDGTIDIKNAFDQSWTMDRAAGTTTLQNGTTTIKTDQNDSIVTVTANKVVVNALKRAEVNSFGTVLVKARQACSIVSAKVISLGKDEESAGEPFVLGNVFVDMMKKLLSAISNHTHLGNLGTPTPPPLNKAEFESIKVSPIGDKLVLSDLIKGEK